MQRRASGGRGVGRRTRWAVALALGLVLTASGVAAAPDDWPDPLSPSPQHAPPRNAADAEIRAAYEVASDLRRQLRSHEAGASDEPVYHFVARLHEAARRAAWATTARREALVQAAFYRDWPEPVTLARLARALGDDPTPTAEGKPVLGRLLGLSPRFTEAVAGEDSGAFEEEATVEQPPR